METGEEAEQPHHDCAGEVGGAGGGGGACQGKLIGPRVRMSERAAAAGPCCGRPGWSHCSPTGRAL